MVLKSFDQGFALFILVEAPPFAKLEIKILFQNNTFSKTGATRVLSLFLAWDTPNQTPTPGGTTPSCFFLGATSMLALALVFNMLLDLDTTPHI